MNRILKTLIPLLIFASSFLQAQDPAQPAATPPGTLAPTASQQAFIEALTKALESKNKQAFYALVCHDGMDDEWKATVSKGFDQILAWAQSGRKFTITLEEPDPARVQPRPLKDILIVYNLTVTAVCMINWADTDKETGSKSAVNLGEKDGKTMISVYVPQKQT